MFTHKKLSNFRSVLVISTLLCLISCNDEPTGSTNNSSTPTPSLTLVESFGSTSNRDFMGRVVDLQNNPVSGALVQIGNSTTDTDMNGIFIIKNAQVYEKFAFIKVEKAGFLHGSRSVVPTDGINQVQIMLLPQTVTQTVSSGTAATVSLSNGAAVYLSGVYSNADGSDYSGDVQVTLHLLNPTDDNMQQQMPGMLLAENLQNEARMLETLGMVAVELRGETGEELNLSQGTTATISVPLDPETLAGAPNEIPLWYFDEDNGYWIEEGSATLQGTKYVGTVSHFSFWNCDIPAEYVNICMNITNSNNTPLSSIRVNIESELNGSRSGYTNEDGEVCGIVPASQILDLKYFFHNFCNNQEIPNSSESIGPFYEDTTIDIILDNPEIIEYSETITGVFNTCDGNAVVNGYVEGSLEGGASFYTIVTDGIFDITILSCYEDSTLSITGYDYDSLETTGAISYTLTSPETDLGVLSACNSVEEFIQYSIDDGPIEYVLSNIEVSIQGNYLEIIYTGDDTGNDWENCFWMTGNLDSNYPNFEGIYQYGYQNVGLFYFTEECPVYPSDANNEITFNLSSFGNSVGEYIDINFSGSYEDYQGVSHTISGVIHVKRDN